MNFLKFIKIGLALFVFVLFTGAVSAQTTYYVDNQFGNNANSGLIGSPVADVAHALAAAPAGSIISIRKTPLDYIDANITITDNFTFTSTEGTPVFVNAVFTINGAGKTATFAGPIEFDGGLYLQNGTVANANNIWVKGTVTRTNLGSISAGQLNFAAASDLVYTNTAAATASVTITTGLEFPTDVTKAKNLSTTRVAAFPVILKLDQARQVNGTITLSDGADLNAFTLTVKGNGAHTYANSAAADITNGTIELIQTANGGSINGVGTSGKLPNVTITDDVPTVAYTAFVIGGGVPPTGIGNVTVNSKASLTATIAGNAGNLTLNGSGAAFLQVAAAGTIGDVLASSTSTGTITYTAVGAVTVKSLTQSGTGTITTGTSATAVTVTNNVLLNSTVPALQSGTGAVAITGKSLITFTAAPLVNVTVGGNVENSAVFSGSSDIAGNTGNAIILFSNTGTLAVAKTTTLNITGSLAKTLAGAGTNNGLILFNSVGNVTLGDVVNSSSVANNAVYTNTATISASGNVVSTKNMTNSTSLFVEAGSHNIDFDATAVALTVTGFIYQTGPTKGGDILLGIGNITVSGDVKSDRGDTGADINVLGAVATTVGAANISNSGKSDIIFGAGGAFTLSGGINSSGSGKIQLVNNNAASSAASLNISSGTVDLGTTVGATSNITITGNAVVTGGTVNFGAGARQLIFKGAQIQIGSATTKATFTGNSTTLVLDEPVPNVVQNIVLGLVDQTWPGPVNITNGATLPAPYVVFKSVDETETAQPGVLRVTNNVTFNTASAVLNTVQVNNARIYVGKNDPSGFGGNFVNNTGFTTLGGGFVMMSGNAAQTVTGTATPVPATPIDLSTYPIFGNFGVDNNGAGNVTFAGNCLMTKEFYLGTGTAGNANIYFYNVEPYPTIYKTSGVFAGALPAGTFKSFTNVVYYGYDKVISDELPPVGKLWDLRVETSNGVKPSYGIVTLSANTQVDGKLYIKENQSLYTAGFSLILNGKEVVIDGYLVDNGTTKVELATPTGIAFTGKGVLPAIKVNDGSFGNSITGYPALYSQYLGVLGTWAGAPATPGKGNIEFAANTGTNKNSLTVSFTGDGPHFNNLDMSLATAASTFSLGANAVMAGNININAGTIALGDYKLTHKGTAFVMTTKDAKITSNAAGSLEFTTAATSLTFAAADIAIDANVTFNANGVITAPVTTSAAINGNVLVNGSSSINTAVQIPNGNVLTLAGPSVTITSPSTITAAVTTGVLKLDRVGAVGTDTLTLSTYGTTIANLTIADNVELAGAIIGSTPGTLTVSTDLIHSGGLFNLGTGSVQVDGKFTRTAGTYEGNGWFIWNGTAANFKHSNVAAAGAMTINNLQVKTALALQDNVALNVIKSLYLNGANLVNQVGTSGSLVTVGNAENIPTVKINGVSTVTVNALTFGNANSDFSFEGASLTSDKLYWPLTATLARNVTLNMGANTNLVTLGASNTINGNVTLTQGILTWDKGTTITLGSGSVITRTHNGGLNKNANADADAGTLTAPNVNLVYTGDIDANAGPVPTAVSGIEYSDPAVVTDVTVGKTGNATKSTVTMAPARTIDGKITLINGTNSGATSSITFNDNTTLSAAQTIASGIINLAAGKTLTLSNTAATTLPTVVIGGTSTVSVAGALTITGFTGGTLVAAENLTINGAFAAGTINASKNVTIASTGTLAATTNLSFVGSTSASFTVPSPGATIANMTINKTDNTDVVTLFGGNLTVNGGTITFINGLFVTGSYTLQIAQPTWGGGQAFDRTQVTGTRISHVVGKVAKILVNTATVATSSEPRVEFPVGSYEVYRGATINFPTLFGQLPTVPSGVVTVNHVADVSPTGAVGLPIIDGVADGIDVARYPNFYWTIKSEPSIGPDKPFDLELTATGFTDFDDINNIRIIRRHGTITDEENQWWLQGTNTSYDNEISAGVATAIQRGANAGLRAGGAVFTLGVKSNLVVANPIPKQFLTVAEGVKDIDLTDVFAGNSGALSFSAQSANAAVATVAVSGSTLKITPVAVGDVVVTIVASDANNNDFYAYSFDVNVKTIVGVEEESLPTEFALYQNFPNPFNPTTNVKFDLPKESNVAVKIYNILGEEVATLVNKVMQAGRHTVEFNASKLTSGMYIYRIEADNFVQVKKMLLMK